MQFFIDRWETVTKALGVRRYLIGSAVSAIVAFVDSISQRIWPDSSSNPILGISSWIIGTIALLAILTWALLNYATRLTVEQRPKIKLSLVPDAKKLHKLTDGLGAERTVMQQFVRVRAIGQSHSDVASKAYLTKVISPDGKDVLFASSLPSIALMWSATGVESEVIPLGVERHIDVLKSGFIKDEKWSVALSSQPIHQFRALFNDAGKYTLQIVVLTGPASSTITLIVEFGQDHALLSLSEVKSELS